MRTYIIIKFIILILTICSLSSCLATFDERDELNTSDINSSSNIKSISKSLSSYNLIDYMFIEANPGKSIFIYNKHVDFVINKDQKKLFNGIRSEISVNYPYNVGDQVEYKFEIKIPEDFKSDKEKIRWWTFAQWHDQPNPNLGETWSNFEGSPPPVSLFTEDRNNQFGIGINYLNDRIWLPVKKGVWIKLSFSFVWSNKEDGSLVVNISNMYTHKFYGTNMLNEYYHYLKIGMYRHPKINTENRLSYRNLSINHIKNEDTQ